MGYATKELVEEVRGTYPEYREIDTFVETGTWKAVSVLNILGLFKTIHTIEISEKVYREALNTHGAKPIHFHLGDSSHVLPELLTRINEPAFFYLDAHACVNRITQSDNPLPLWDELRAIADRPYADVIVIDDVHAFERDRHPSGVPDPAPWSQVSVTAILDHIGRSRIRDWKIFHPGSHDCMVVWLR